MLHDISISDVLYKDHAGLDYSVHSRIVSPFSQQIAGHASALESMGAK